MGGAVTFLRFPTHDDFQHTHMCAEMIKSYWLSHGHHVKVDVVELPWNADSGAKIYGLRSDLVNGKPVGFRE